MKIAVLIFVAVILIGVWLLVAVTRSAERHRIPIRKIRYDDTGAARQAPRPLYDPELDLAGKPDYILETRDGLVPVEVKSGATPREPLPGHVLQLLAYCYLIDVTTGRAPSRGILRYPASSFEISYTIREREQLRVVVEAIRCAGADGYPRSHDNPGRCRRCGYESICDASLVDETP